MKKKVNKNERANRKKMKKKLITYNDIRPNGGGRKGLMLGSSRPVPTGLVSTYHNY